MQTITWPMLTFPPINLWNAPILAQHRARQAEVAQTTPRAPVKKDRPQADVKATIQALTQDR